MSQSLWKTILLICILLSISSNIPAQRPRIEYGSPEELKGITKIFVSTDTEESARSNIIKEINKKQLPSLTIVDKAEDAEILLFYEVTKRGQKKIIGHGYAARLIGANHLRILVDFDDSRASLLERRPSTNFARAFIKAYMEANKGTTG